MFSGVNGVGVIRVGAAIDWTRALQWPDAPLPLLFLVMSFLRASPLDDSTVRREPGTAIEPHGYVIERVPTGPSLTYAHPSVKAARPGSAVRARVPRLLNLAKSIDTRRRPTTVDP